MKVGNAPNYFLIIYDIYLKIYGFIIIYALGLYEVLMQYVWLFKYRTGILAGPDESLYRKGTNVLITGGLGGVGREVVKKFLQHNNFVIILDVVHPADASKIIPTLGSPSSVRYFYVDLCDLDAVKRTCNDLIKLNLLPEILHFNAGIMHAPYRLHGGFESQFLISYLAHCLILSELHSLLPDEFRVVFTTSVCHKPAFIDFDDMNGKKAYSSHLAYSQAKFCQVLMAKYLSSKMDVVTVHPGVVDTGLYKHVVFRFILMPICIMTTAEAALCPTYACLSSDAKNKSGEYFEFCRVVKATSSAYDTALQEKLYHKTVEMLQPYTNFAKVISSPRKSTKSS